jgi:uncharacterized membrane protein
MRVGVYKPVGSHLMSMLLPHTILTLSTYSVCMCFELLWLNSVLRMTCYMLRHCCILGKVAQHMAVTELPLTLSHTVATAVTAVTAVTAPAAAAVTITVTVRVTVTATAAAKATAAPVVATVVAAATTAAVFAATAVTYKMIHR